MSSVKLIFWRIFSELLQQEFYWLPFFVKEWKFSNVYFLSLLEAVQKEKAFFILNGMWIMIGRFFSSVQCFDWLWRRTARFQALALWLESLEKTVGSVSSGTRAVRTRTVWARKESTTWNLPMFLWTSTLTTKKKRWISLQVWSADC